MILNPVAGRVLVLLSLAAAAVLCNPSSAPTPSAQRFQHNWENRLHSPPPSQQPFNSPTTSASERALLHILQIHINPAILESYLASIDKKDVKALADYCKRVLAKLAPESDDEKEGGEES